jgi:hypothetical protein
MRHFEKVDIRMGNALAVCQLPGAASFVCEDEEKTGPSLGIPAQFH